MKSIFSLLVLAVLGSSAVSEAAVYNCEGYKANWYGVTPKNPKGSKDEKSCGGARIDSSSTKNTIFIENCDSLVVSISDVAGQASSFGVAGQMAQVRLLEPGRAGDWERRSFQKQSTVEMIGVSKGFRLDLALDQSTFTLDKSVSWGVVCKLVE